MFKLNLISGKKHKPNKSQSLPLRKGCITTGPWLNKQISHASIECVERMRY